MGKGSTWNASESPLNGSYGIQPKYLFGRYQFPTFFRVWGSEETVNEYKARIRIFSVRHQVTPGVLERFAQKKIVLKTEKRRLEVEGRHSEEMRKP